MRAFLAVGGGLLAGLGWLGAAAAQDIQVDQVWARASIGQVANSAAYFSLENRGKVADRLVSVESPVAERSELHDHVMQDDIARMVQVEAIELAAGESMTLAPGGLHVMLMGLAEPLQVGDSVPLTLHFEQAGHLDVEAEVRPLRAEGHRHDHDYRHDHDHDHGHAEDHEHHH